MNIPPVPWMNNLKIKKGNILHMIQTDTWKFGTHVPFLFTKLQRIFICIYNRRRFKSTQWTTFFSV